MGLPPTRLEKHRHRDLDAAAAASHNPVARARRFAERYFFGVAAGRATRVWIERSATMLEDKRPSAHPPFDAGAWQTFPSCRRRTAAEMAPAGAYIDESEAGVLTHLDIPAQHRRKRARPACWNA